MNRSVYIFNSIFVNYFILLPIRASPADRLSELGEDKATGRPESSLSVPNRAYRTARKAFHKGV